MLPSIKFNYQFLLNTGEVGNELPNRMLATKAVSLKLFAAQSSPQYTFDIGHATSKRSRS